MKSLWLCAAALIATGGKLSTDYTQKRSLRIDVTSSIETELKSMSMERDGEPVDSPMSGMSSTSNRHMVWVDTLIENAEGAPTKVRREFEDLASESSTTWGDRQMDSAMNPRLAGVTLEITREGDEVEVKVAEGDADEEALEGHSIELLLDAFLPSGDQESWELDNAAIRRGLALDIEKALFAPPDAPEGGGDGGRGRGRRGPGGGSAGGALSMAEFSGRAELAKETEEHEGVECLVVKIKIEASGDLPEPEGFGGGRGRMFDPAPPAVLVRGSSYEIELEGRLLFDPKTKAPAHLKLEGSIEVEMSSERTWNDSTIKMESVTGGEIEYEVTISAVGE